MKHFAPKGMHYVVLEVWPDGSEHFIMSTNELNTAKQAMHEVYQCLIFIDPKVRIILRCVDN